MKVNKILFLIAGILRAVVAAFVGFVTLCIFALKTILKEMFLKSYDLIENIVKDLSASDPNYEYLLENTKEANIDFVINLLDKFCIIVLLWVAVVVALAVFSFLYYKKCKYSSVVVDWKSITFVVVSWLCPLSMLSAILTTVAVFYNKKTTINYNDTVEIKEN